MYHKLRMYKIKWACPGILVLKLGHDNTSIYKSLLNCPNFAMAVLEESVTLCQNIEKENNKTSQEKKVRLFCNTCVTHLHTKEAKKSALFFWL